jgi:hypothetical protein
MDGDNTVEAHARGPAGISITARSSRINADDSGTELALSVPVSSFKTGIGLRDEHMSKMLEADSYPEVKLVVKDSGFKLPGVDDTVKGSVQGNLTFHGVTRSVVVSYVAVGDCEGYVGARATFNVNLPDFGITPPSYLGINVKPVVEIVANLRFNTNDT